MTTSPRNLGKTGSRHLISFSACAKSRPRHAASKPKGAAAAHACGEHATGYAVGPRCGRRTNPQKSSGRRRSSWWAAALNKPSKTEAASCFKPYRANPSEVGHLAEPSLVHDLARLRVDLGVGRDRLARG